MREIIIKVYSFDELDQKARIFAISKQIEALHSRLQAIYFHGINAIQGIPEDIFGLFEEYLATLSKENKYTISLFYPLTDIDMFSKIILAANHDYVQTRCRKFDYLEDGRIYFRDPW